MRLREEASISVNSQIGEVWSICPVVFTTRLENKTKRSLPSAVLKEVTKVSRYFSCFSKLPLFS